MPQLNPTPWLMILVASWLTLLILFTPKTSSTLPQNMPLTESKTTQKINPWNWPWA